MKIDREQFLAAALMISACSGCASAGRQPPAHAGHYPPPAAHPGTWPTDPGVPPGQPPPPASQPGPHGQQPDLVRVVGELVVHLPGLGPPPSAQGEPVQPFPSWEGGLPPLPSWPSWEGAAPPYPSSE